MSFARNARGVAGGLIWDRVLGEPPNGIHPVALFGRAMGWLERRVWADSRLNGLGYAVAGVALGATAGAATRSTTVAVGVSVAGRELRRVAKTIEDALIAGDLNEARRLLPSLVGRDPSGLDESQIAAAVIESLAENMVDAVVAPVWWGLLLGAPGAAGYRAINTMDAMVGHRSERYENFGRAAARLDDVANLAPARLFALVVALVSPRQAGAIARIVRRDAAAHPSPNAGVAESAVAAALGRQLGGQLRYGSRVEDRPLLGDGPRPGPADVARARELTERVEVALLIGLIAMFPTRSHCGPAA
ncbi:adenosylcobinamide-phosphate synthase CbiB [Ornithinimicrobium sp. INDO-MA30-4]|uniref:adenosylcobinamide-phosphate synthase CbiB n=1 Tax=Ornithinimicrobium sp. INDO-MA30-4 TaxID=2908651 RepID=UPI001F43E193|nr:adenosylcobinamide-phosphate synthase CbiB [Ornithinimicrobium sp. INDO-MA30-4]UJH69951.1 adenosylcobinamide-phosphate synthase CbiB [Ornithinimicrobium sp. INDO-MA30-4]